MPLLDASRRPARVTLTLRYLAIFFTLLVVFAAGLEVWLRGELQERLQSDLAREADFVQERVLETWAATTNDEERAARITSALAFIEHPTRVDAFQMLDIGADPRGGPRLVEGRVGVARSPRRDAASEAALEGSEGLRAHPKNPGLTPRLEITVASSRAEEADTIREFRGAVVLALLATLVLGGGGGYVLAKAALKPVDDVARAAARIDARSLDARLPKRNVEDELGRLVETLNRMLARIEQGVTAARRFTQDASHELKTPIAAIKGTTDVALSGKRDASEDERAFQAIARECERLERIVRDLLTIARADAGALVEKKERLDLRAVLTEVVEVGEILAQEKGATLSSELGQDELPVEGDFARLRQVGLNLVDNAIRYGKPGGRVRVVASREGSQAFFAVEDDGPGIPESERERVFERFHRARRDVPGVGLGLAIARAIVEEHGGSIGAFEREGGGAKFVVRLALKA